MDLGVGMLAISHYCSRALARYVQSPRSFCGGWSFVELMAVIGIAAVGIVIAIPSFSNAMSRNRLAVTSNSVLESLMVARQVSVTKNAFVVVCAGSPELGCTGDWAAQAWMVFVDRNRSRGYDVDDTVHSTYQLDGTNDLQISANGPFKKLVVFVPTGAAETATGAFAAGRIRICAPKDLPTINANDLVLIGSGRAVTEPRNFSGQCPSADNSR